MYRRRPVSHQRVGRWRRYAYLALLVCAAGIVWFFWSSKVASHHLAFESEKVPDDFWGITFSTKYAQELGLDWRELYLALLDDLGVRYIRIPIYWDAIETAPDQLNFSDYDWLFDEAATRGVRIIPAVGRRLPRWPECHQPTWASALSDDAMNERHILMTQRTVDHFKHRPEILYWQLENEYFLPWFGLCPKANESLLEVEIRYVRSVDARPILLTESGEINTWLKASRFSDILGTTMYRVVWNKYLGYMRLSWPAWWYRGKARLIGRDPSRAIVAELQAEPWPGQFKHVTQIDDQEAYKSFNVKQLETNSELARRTGFDQAYFWGVEWWYWMKKKGDPSFWDAGRAIIHTSDVGN